MAVGSREFFFFRDRVGSGFPSLSATQPRSGIPGALSSRGRALWQAGTSGRDLVMSDHSSCNTRQESRIEQHMPKLIPQLFLQWNNNTTFQPIEYNTA